ncbi:hypothetical protein OSB04_022523 [Centaurea solstitialis]|uniref:Uncharacterized protein n=1 Tax=Centaurea solstitialis TaxID=347529 RepID=A0AA38WF86_9ASTR|nr:hypothetical protein OSB04_022523 [Centaurea solstitialis]
MTLWNMLRLYGFHLLCQDPFTRCHRHPLAGKSQKKPEKARNLISISSSKSQSIHAAKEKEPQSTTLLIQPPQSISFQNPSAPVLLPVDLQFVTATLPTDSQPPTRKYASNVNNIVGAISSLKIEWTWICKLSLVPKFQTPKGVVDLGPLHVVMSFTNALARQICDNVLLGQELMRGYHRQRGIRRCAFKIDIQLIGAFLRPF